MIVFCVDIAVDGYLNSVIICVDAALLTEKMKCIKSDELNGN